MDITSTSYNIIQRRNLDMYKILDINKLEIESTLNDPKYRW